MADPKNHIYGVDRHKIAMDPDTVARIDAAAVAAGISRSEWVRRACETSLDA